MLLLQLSFVVVLFFFFLVPFTYIIHMMERVRALHSNQLLVFAHDHSRFGFGFGFAHHRCTGRRWTSSAG